jgi:uncharacterized membrane protein YdfJ with MMPL/SSD domain
MAAADASRRTQPRRGIGGHALDALAAAGTRAPRRTLLATAVVAVVAAFAGSASVNHFSSNEAEFSVHHSQSYDTERLLKRALGLKAFPNLALIVPTELLNGAKEVSVFGVPFLLSGSGESSVLATVRQLATLLPRLFYSRNGQLVAMLGYFHRGVAPEAAAAALAQRFRALPNVAIGGSALVDHQFVVQTKRDLVEAELIAFPLILLFALAIFRGLAAALLPVLTGGMSLGGALLGLRAINAVYPVSIFSLDVAIGLAVGLCLDYSLLMVTRFREELERRGEAHGAIVATMSTAGRTVAISSMTVAAAFASLLVFPLELLRSFAIGGMLAAIMAGLVSLLALPAVLTLLGYRVNALAPKRWQRSVARTARPAESGAWYRLAHMVMARPATIAVAAASVLVIVGAPSLGIRLTGFDADSLPTSTSSHKFENRMKAEFVHPLYNEVIVVAHGDRASITALGSRYMSKLPDVVSDELSHVKGNLWTFSLTPRSPPFSGAAKSLVRKLRALPAGLAVTGPTAGYIDTAASLRSHLPVALAILVITMLVFLFIATGSVILPVKAIVMNVLSLAAASGVLVFVFQDDRLEGLLEYRGVGALVLTQPILMVVGTFGMSTDYGVFLLTRIREGWDAGLPNDEAVALGLERSGRIITAAALLFCIAVGSLITAKLTFVKEAGLGLAAVVAIDATIVRALLVPSLMTLLGRWNWWRPKLLPWRTPTVELDASREHVLER